MVISNAGLFIDQAESMLTSLSDIEYLDNKVLESLSSAKEVLVAPYKVTDVSASKVQENDEANFYSAVTRHFEANPFKLPDNLKVRVGKVKEFTFASKGDTNGLLHYIGTKGKTAAYSNPHSSSGGVGVYASSSSSYVGKDETIVRTHYRADANPPPSLREYDRRMVDRIRKRWQQEKLDGKAAGKGVVKVGFRLGADGNVSDVHVIETSLPAAAEAGKRAIILSAPFESWPQDVLQLLEGKPREILINFGYVLK